MNDKTLSQEPCDDTISREAILSKIKEVCFSKEWTQFRVDNGSHGQRDFLINYIEQLPSVTKKSGKWQPRYNIFGVTFCSECGYELKINNTNYCPDCGAKMVEPQESEGDACKDCDYNDGEVHAECVVCDKAENEDKDL